MSAYSDVEKELYAEAIRTIPGVVAARQREDSSAVNLLLEGYFQVAGARKIGKDRAWAVLFTATMSHMGSLTREIAHHRAEEVSDTTARMGSQAALWVAETRGVSGY